MEYITYSLYNYTGAAYERVTVNRYSYLFDYPCDNRTYCEPYKVLLNSGLYKIELWGASGGNARNYNSAKFPQTANAGNGAYVKGIIKLLKLTQLFIYLGGQGEDLITTESLTNPIKGGWNFGGNCGIDYHDKGATDDIPENGAGGGGSVDVRIDFFDINGNLTDESALLRSTKSRIIVAGSGGGACAGIKPKGQPGGNLSAISVNSFMFGGTQTSGPLGKGMNGLSSADDNLGGTGGFGAGYRGGYAIESLAGNNIYEWGATGGSSYISGHPGCISVSSDLSSDISNGTSIHYSGLYFRDTKMLAGNQLMTLPDGSQNIGHSGNGVCRITVLPLSCCTKENCFSYNRLIYLYVFIFLLD